MRNPKQIIVTGSRDWDKSNYIYSLLHSLDPDLLIQGGARGADKIAYDWCKLTGCEVITVNANWKKLGKRAGMLRNIQMLELYPDSELHAFLRDASKGTLGCVFAAKERGMKVIIHHYDNV